MGLGFTEIMLIVLAVLLLFGAKRIPELARAFGKASYEFKQAKETIKKEAKEITDAVEETIAQEEEKAANEAKKS